MQAHSAAWDDSLAGSVQPAVQVDAWYDGQLIAEDLPIVSGTVTMDTTRTNVTTAALVVGSPDATVLPDSWQSALACYGTQLHIRSGIVLPGGQRELMSLDWLRIDSYATVEAWGPYRRYKPGDGPLYPSWDLFPSETLFPDGIVRGDPVTTWVPRGVQVSVQCSDLMSALTDAQFLAPEQPPSLASAVAEIQRIAAAAGVASGDMSNVTDVAIPRSTTYQTSRTAAIGTLANLMDATAYMSPNGALQLAPNEPGASVWTVSVNTGVPVQAFTRAGDRTGLYNAVISSSTDAKGNPLQAVAIEQTGPLRYGGPFGMVPYTRQAPLATTQAALQADAQTTLAHLIEQRTVTIPLTVPANAALQPWDVITVELPDRTLTGQVVSMSLPLGVGSMQVGLAVGRASLWNV